MGDRLDVSVPVLLDAAGRTDLAIEMASEDLAVVARAMSTGSECWPGAAGAAYSALLSVWEAADSVLATEVKDLAARLQASAREYAEADNRTPACQGSQGFISAIPWAESIHVYLHAYVHVSL